jgi:hypothetical protein
MNTSARWSTALFMLGMSALILAFSINCHDGGGSAGAQTTTASLYRIHESAVSGIIPIPASSTNYVVRSVTFTPSSPNDLLLRIQVEGTSTGTVTQGSAYIHVVGSTGQVTDSSVFNLPIAVDLPFKASLGILDSIFPMPTTSYTITFFATTDAAWAGSVSSVVIRIWTLEGASVLSPSPSIS